jgi:outer membrane autotransporter protein
MRASEQTLVTPFVQLSYTDAHIDGYRETGGPFPVTFQDIDTNTTVGQIGVMEETDVSETITVFGSIAWAQVLDADNPEVRGAVLDIFEVSSDGAGNIDGWAEFMGGARYQVSQAGVISVSGRVSTEFDDFATLNGRIGYSQTF